MMTVDSLFLLKAARFSILSALEAALVKTSNLAPCLRNEFVYSLKIVR